MIKANQKQLSKIYMQGIADMLKVSIKKKIRIRVAEQNISSLSDGENPRESMVEDSSSLH
jgi:hypothetical protein